MLFENVYLVETPLTSTKNKILEESSREMQEFLSRHILTENYVGNLTGTTGYQLKRKEASFDAVDGSSKRSLLLSTENKYLPKPPLPAQKKKKKKFLSKMKYRSVRKCAPAAGLDINTSSSSRSRSYEPPSPLYCPTHSEADDFILGNLGDQIPPEGTLFSDVNKLDSSSAVGTFGDRILRETSLSSDAKRLECSPITQAGGSEMLFGSQTLGLHLPPGNVPVFGGPAPGGPQAFGAGYFSLGSANAPKLAACMPSARTKILRAATLLPPAMKSLPVVDILEMPVYKFSLGAEHEKTVVETFQSSSVDSHLLQLKLAQAVKAMKLRLLNAASVALLYSSNLKDPEDSYRDFLQISAKSVIMFDPEFVLKVALYARQELHIRSAANFLLAYAALNENTSLYLRKYFEAAIVLPSDWIDVAEYYQVLKNVDLGKKSLPAALRKVMKKSFEKFDEYQLAKYNRNKGGKKNKEKIRLNSMEVLYSEDDNESGKKSVCQKTFTLKQLIRLLHINSPVEYVMCLLGKKYPESQAAFHSSGLPGKWESRRAGQRMKLPVPETWETQISSKGNKPSVWESLIDNSKLPYMAMLRNIRNLILSGISMKHHEKVLKHLENKHAVMNSRQFPIQFFEAYKIVAELESMLQQPSRMSIDIDDLNAKSVPFWKIQQQKNFQERLGNASLTLLERYKNVLSNAVEISSLNNLHPIPGKTLVLCEISSLKQGGKSNKISETCIMMGLMCLKACEDCKMHLLSPNKARRIIKPGENDLFLQIMKNLCEDFDENSYGRKPDNYLENLLEYYLKPQTMYTEKLDHVISLRGTSDSDVYYVKEKVATFLEKYRQLVNSELLYTDVDLSLRINSFANANSENEKDVYLFGYTNQLLRFIAERSTGGQLAYVENIDLKYNLPDIRKINKLKQESRSFQPEKEEILYLNKTPKWHIVRIFISSTFKDMHAERDLLIRYVFPELRKRSGSIFVHINELDLRWGISEGDSATKRAAELCLLEAQKADIFIGLLGERYGTIYDFDPPDSPELQWVKDCPPGLSITELEIYAGALRNPDLSKKKALFYFRDNSVINNIPPNWKNNFTSENKESKTKIDALKEKIKLAGFKVFEGYPSRWAGIHKNQPVLAGLELFGQSVLEDIWTAVNEIHNKEPYLDDITEEDIYQQQLLYSHNSYISRKDSFVDSIVNKVKRAGGLYLITGAPGSGKTAFAVDILQKLKGYAVVTFFVGVSPRSMDLSYMLHYISSSIVRKFPVSSAFPVLSKDIVNQFPDILHEAVNSTCNKNFTLLIDGLDHMELEDQRLDWLPFSLPDGLRLIFTTSDTSLAFKALRGRDSEGCPMTVESVNPLQQSDKERIVRNYLQLYGKSLDERSFSNHLLQVVTKRDSGSPLYLRLLCDYMRIYASYENLMPTLQHLPSTTISLLEEIILQMENDFGYQTVQTVLTLLCITKEGLEESDLYFLLSFVIKTEMKTSINFKELLVKLTSLKPEDLLSQVKFCSLMHIICTFAFGHSRQKTVKLIGSEFEKAAKKFYLNKNFTTVSRYLHSVIAAYYHIICDLKCDGSWTGLSGATFRGLLYHLFNGMCYPELANLLCNHKFLEAIFRVKAEDQLQEYYSSLLYECEKSSSKVCKEVDVSVLSSYSDFVSRNMHIFYEYPQLVTQQALNEPLDSLVSAKSNDRKICIIECLSRGSSSDFRVSTLGGFLKNITAAACQKFKQFAVLGSEDGYLKILDLCSRKVVRRLKTHMSAITSVCFAGKNRICLSSTDTTLSIWSIDDFSRIAVLKGHRHNVTCCCADPAGSILFSSGWDNSIRLWSLRDGRSISVIQDFRCPVNCIDHHPCKEQIACGLWNGNIEIWDTVSMQRKLSFPSFSGSVKSIAYTSDGINIISSFIHSEVIIWSSEQGLKVSNLKGHFLPVKTISCSYTENVFVSGSDDCTLKVWSSEFGYCIKTLSECKFCPINQLQFVTPNYLAVAFQNSDIWVIDINNGHVTSKMSVSLDLLSCFSKYHKCSGSTESTTKWFHISVVFGTKSGKIMVGNCSSSSISTVSSLDSKITAVIHNETSIFCGTANGDIGIFSYPEIRPSKIINGTHVGSVVALSLFTQGKTMMALSAASDKMMKLWTVGEDNIEVLLKGEYVNKHKDCISCFCFLQSSTDCVDCTEISNLLTGSHDNNIILWDEKNGIIFQGLQTSVIEISHSDNSILGCGNDGSVVMWSRDGKLLSTINGIDQSSAVLTFYIEKDASCDFDVTLAYVDIDGTVKIKKPLQRPYWYSLDGHSKAITSCCTNENGQVLSCSLDGTVNLWKVPLDAPDNSFKHFSTVTDIIVSYSCNLVLSSDMQGRVVLWKVNLSSDSSPLLYAAEKIYANGFIRALSWLKGHSFVCAVSLASSEEKYFLDVISYEHETQDGLSPYKLIVKYSHYFESEIYCLDTCSKADIIVAGLKSGEVSIIAPDSKRQIKLFQDWILQTKLLSSDGSSTDTVCFSSVEGDVQYFSLSDIMKSKDKDINHIKRYERPDSSDSSSYITCLYCYKNEIVLCGDTQGYLRMYYSDSSRMEFKKVHNDSVSGICVVGSYIFSSSLDRTVKGWNSSTLKQVCQYHSSVPISCLVAPKTKSGCLTEKSHHLLIGTTSGVVHLLKFHAL